MVKYVLFSLSLLSMLIGLGDAGGPDSEICEFSIAPQLALKCDSTVDNVVNMTKIIDQCNGTVKFDVFFDESVVKARVSCLVENLGADIIVTQSSGPVVYDVFRFSFENEDHTSVISAELLSDYEYSRHGLWMKTGGEVSIKLIVSNRLMMIIWNKELDLGFLQGHRWEKSLRFEPKEAPRNQATLVMLHETGVIITNRLDSKNAHAETIEVAIEDEGKNKLAILLLEDRTERLFEAVPNQPSVFKRKETKFEARYNSGGLPRPLTKVKNGKDSAGVAKSSSRRRSGSRSPTRSLKSRSTEA